jgi:hypothetical protein
MRKALGLAIALTLALPLAASADEMWGTIRYTNPADHSIVMDDGTRLWVSEGQFAELSLGDQVKASYETTGDKKIVTELSRRVAPDGALDPLESVQTGD